LSASAYRDESSPYQQTTTSSSNRFGGFFHHSSPSGPSPPSSSTTSPPHHRLFHLHHSSPSSPATSPTSPAAKAVATRISTLSAMVLNSMETKSGSVTRVLSKKAGRAKERLLQNFGKADRTTDQLFELYNNNFNKQQNAAIRLQKEMKNYVTCLRALQSANKGVMDSLADIYEPEWPGHDQLPVKGQALEIYWEDLCHKLNDQVTIPLSTYLSQFSEIRAKIGKRGRKLVDYDSARHTVESLESKTGKKDEIKIAKSREAMEEARRLYDVLNKELHDELPALFDSRIPFLIASLQTLFAAETVFHGENAKIYAQLGELIDTMAIEAQKGSFHSTSTVAMNQRQLTPSAHMYPSIKQQQSGEPNGDHSSPKGIKRGDGQLDSSPEAGKPVEGLGPNVIPAGATTTDLPPGVLYKVRATYKYVAEDGDELNFEAGEIIRVVEFEDPEEQEDGWLMGMKESSGEKGLFPANFTRPI